jgi:DNA helicase IV
MNINDYTDELIKEEQDVLDDLISRMDKVINKLDEQMKKYVYEAKNSDISINPDEGMAIKSAQKGKKDAANKKEELRKTRDELYHTRLLLQYEDSSGIGISEVKIGLHSCRHSDEEFVSSWTTPLCRHYVLDNSATKYENIVKDKHGDEYHTQYKLLVKNKVTLWFTHVKKAINIFPGMFDDKTLEMIKGKGFVSDEFLDEMIKRFNAEDYNPDVAERILYDEFLLELLERRTSHEFKNIVFSIQKKQSEIIQAPYKRNMIVQGCAGSGKSMIMLHRLPIILYDNPNSLGRTKLYVISPSQMYIQMAENMRHQLEISDINMGTIEQYYDYCITKYPGHKEGEYGKINYGSKISSENELYVYSQKCIDDIKAFFDEMVNNEVSLEKAYSVLKIKDEISRSCDTYARKISNRFLRIQRVMTANNEILGIYFKRIRDVLDSLYIFSATLRNRKSAVVKVITMQISEHDGKIVKAQKDLERLDPETNMLAVQNRYNVIESSQDKIGHLNSDMVSVEADDAYFESLMGLNSKIVSVLDPFSSLKNEFSQNTAKNIYDAIDRIGQLIGGYFMLSWEFSKIDDKYMSYLDPISKDVEQARNAVAILQSTTGNYLDFEYFCKIREEREKLSNASANAVRAAYEMIMGNIGINPSANGNIRAIKCSPYIYLQTLYCFQGAPSNRESLIAIDEAQGIAKEEIRLLKNINGNNVIFNMYGDINQHIEGTKGVDSWDEYKDIIDFDYQEMLENYRNASQVTEYCNNVFGMKMRAINTPGNGVHVFNDESSFCRGLIGQLMDTQREGLAAILVSNGAEAGKLKDMFASYEQNFNDMTDEEVGIHRTRWNIMNVDDAKGLEFSSVIVLTGRMSRNEKYIAFTRALDDLYVYPCLLDITGFEKKPRKKKNEDSESYVESETELDTKDKTKHAPKKVDKDYSNSEVRMFFEDNGLEVIDGRNQGGRLWVIGDKASIRTVVNSAIAKFGISGKYAAGKETNNKSGWCTKTDK